MNCFCEIFEYYHYITKLSESRRDVLQCLYKIKSAEAGASDGASQVGYSRMVLRL